MPTEYRNGFTARYRWPIALAAALATVIMLVLAYRLTEPTMTTLGGEGIPESDVLRVGALPVT